MNEKVSNSDAFYVLVSASDLGTAELTGFTVKVGNANGNGSSMTITVSSSQVCNNHRGALSVQLRPCILERENRGESRKRRLCSGCFSSAKV